MNVIFAGICLLSIIVLAITSPDKLLPSLMGGAERSVKTALTLFCVYAVWMGLSRLAEKSGLSRGASRLLKPLSAKVFRTRNEKASELLAMNLSCNLLGIGGAATPYAVKAVKELEKDENTWAQTLLFVINATSIQLLPSTVIALRAGAGSASAYDIFLPSLICTFVSTFTAVLLFVLLKKVRLKRKWR